MDEHEARLKRLKMRSMRRGIKEMDLILSDYAERRLPEMTSAELDEYEVLLEENDIDLYAWITGAKPCPQELLDLITRIAHDARGIVSPNR